MDCRERRSHARGVYPTQYTSRMETARVKEEVGADTSVIVKERHMKLVRAFSLSHDAWSLDTWHVNRQTVVLPL